MGERKAVPCKNCKNIFKGSFSAYGIYCSNKCQQEYQFNIRYKKFINDEYNIFKNCKPRRLALAKFYGYFCSVCLLKEWNNKPITLEIDHVDGNAVNDRLSNLRLICPNCHSQTESFKNKNRGNGRHTRRDRYKNGLSY